MRLSMRRHRYPFSGHHQPRKRLWHPTRQPAGRRAPFLTDTVNKSRAPCPAEDFAVTHHHFALDTVLPRKLTCPLIGISIVLPSFRQLILRVRTMARSLDTSPGFQTHKTSRCVIRLAVQHFHQAGTQLHRHRGFITGDRGIGIRPFNQHGFRKTS